MAGDQIVVNYEELKKSIEIFSQEAEKIQVLYETVSHQIENLIGSGFKGKAAGTFHHEMESLALPGLKKLTAAFMVGQDSLNEIFQNFQQAEDEAARFFNSKEYESNYQNFVKDAFAGQFFDMKASFNQFRLFLKWRSADYDQKLAMVNEFQNYLTNEYGYPPAEIKISQLEDYDLDSLGQASSDGKLIQIDIDNFEENQPKLIFETIAHENRHIMQMYYINHPENLPSSISSEQIKNWEENLNNYISGFDDYEGYSKQPLESDASEFAEKIMDDFYMHGKGFGEVIQVDHRME